MYEKRNNCSDCVGCLGDRNVICANVLGLLAYRALTERLIARREADTESNRAMSLERAVQDRTRELRDANDRLRAEAAERAAAEAQLPPVHKMAAVGPLTGGIAHAFNNILAVLVGGRDPARPQPGTPPPTAEFQPATHREPP